MNPLIQLKEIGQGVWYDSMRRGLIESGELKRMIEEYGLSGITSNPTIFERSIAATAEYDSEISRLAAGGLEGADIVYGLMQEDIRLAADIFLPLFRKSGGKDGFVSIEVNPLFARDPEGTLREAKRLFSAIDRPNLMVKVPGTAEGLAVIEELTHQGHGINVTLLFSVRRYEDVALAYIRGLERRAAEGKPLGGIHAVASFFVSRVDTLADRIIEQRIEKAASNDEKARLRALLGKVALANAKLAFVKYNEIFQSDRFKKLKEKGAGPQRLLWASTGTKNPRYSDVKYVEGLIEKGTVNTMPMATMLAFYDHGKARPSLAEGLDEARRVISELDAVGIDYERMMKRLEEDGIKGFADSYGALMECVTGKKAALAAHGCAMEYELNGYEAPVAEAVEEMGNESFLERLWAKDPTLWKTSPQDKKIIKQALGWLTLPEVMRSHSDVITSFAGQVKDAGFKTVVLLGMGGSSLAPLVLKEAFGAAPGWPELKVLDSTDPGAVKGVEESVDLLKTLFIVSSKSGSTIEPLSFFEYFYGRLHEKTGDEAGRNFVAITDPGTALEGFSRKYRFRRLFLNPADIGGRYSALSYFGLVPAALAGIDISRLLKSASGISAAAHPCVQEAHNPLVMLGAALGAFAKAGRDKLTFFISEEISGFGLWIEQLIAESTGKEGKGLVPITGEPLASPADYGDDRVFIHIGIGAPPAAAASMLDSLEAAGHPVIRFALEDLYALGGEFLRWEVATAAAGLILGINPFDQPDVELAKKLTIARLNTKGGKASVNPPGINVEGRDLSAWFGKSAFERIKGKGGGFEGAIKGFFGLLEKGDYVGVLAYYNPGDAEAARAFSDLRKAIRDSTGAATQFGYGPRYLHSTGQLHKGGANKGLFLIFCHNSHQDIGIPGSLFSFSELELSQAFGDMEALDSRGCRVALIEVKDPSAGALKEAGAGVIKAISKDS